MILAWRRRLSVVSCSQNGRSELRLRLIFLFSWSAKHARLQGERPAEKTGRGIGQSPLRRLGRDQIRL
jgi:hypothetical protein